jgi:hypothetical protein
MAAISPSSSSSSSATSSSSTTPFYHDGVNMLSSVRSVICLFFCVIYHQASSHHNRRSPHEQVDIAFAMHSETQDAMARTCLAPNSSWSRARALGVGYWMREPLGASVDTLRRFVRSFFCYR